MRARWPTKVPRAWRARVVPVKNTVLWADRSRGLPFKFRTGHPTSVAVFLTPKRQKSLPTVELRGGYGRSGLLGRAYFRDEYGNIYRDMNVKGIGFATLMGGRIVQPIKPRAGVSETFGLLDRDSAIAEKNAAQKFLRAGIRTARPIALIRLKQIVDRRGRKISLKEARRKQMLAPETKEPVIALRAFGTHYRVENLTKAAAKDAIALVSAELKRELTAKEYAEWFAETLGKQLAKIHNADLAHGNPSPHNTTLDCRLVDLDRVRKIKNVSSMYDDIKVAGDTLRMFSSRWMEAYGTPWPGLSRKLRNMFWEAYRQNLLNKQRIKELSSLRP